MKELVQRILNYLLEDKKIPEELIYQLSKSTVKIVENLNLQMDMDLMEKLTILSGAAKYDVACTSSGVDRKGTGKGIGNSIAPGICHTFSADGRCISLLKILFTNECIFNCAYCLNNRDSDVPRASFTPEEICSITQLSVFPLSPYPSVDSYAFPFLIDIL